MVHDEAGYYDHPAILRLRWWSDGRPRWTMLSGKAVVANVAISLEDVPDYARLLVSGLPPERIREFAEDLLARLPPRETFAKTA